MRHRLTLVTILALALALTACGPTAEAPAASPAAEQELSRGEKIAEAYEVAKVEAEVAMAEAEAAAKATPAPGLPADRLYPKCDTLAYVQAGTSDDGIWSVAIVSAPVDTGEATGATGSVQTNASGVPAVYTVVEGDVLNQIAARLCFAETSINVLNGLDSASTIYLGDRLYLYADESLPYVQRDPYPAP